MVIFVLINFLLILIPLITYHKVAKGCLKKVFWFSKVQVFLFIFSNKLNLR